MRRSPSLITVVMIAISTGIRKDASIELTWERVDLASARITLSDMKKGRPRGVRVNRATAGRD